MSEQGDAVTDAPVTFGFVGLGFVGSRLAANLLRAGASVAVNDVVPDAADAVMALGAQWSPTVVALARRVTKVVGVCVRDDAEVRTVIEGPDGLLTGAHPGLVIVIHSTVSPDVCRSLARTARYLDVHVVDACVSGTHTADGEGLTTLVGGPREVVDDCRGYLDSVAPQTYYFGEVGAGATAKLIANMVAITNLIAMQEALTLAISSGVDPTGVMAIAKLSVSTYSPSPQYQGLGSIGLKDMHHVLDLARSCDQQLPVLEAVTAILDNSPG